MVQDYFKYDKIQTGAPLSIKANDGTKTEDGHGVTLGIKSTAQGIQHFTNWNKVSNSIDAKNTIRFEDGQPNKIFYKTNRSTFTALNSARVATDASPGGDFGSVVGKAQPFGSEYVSFIDEWSAEDIKILDDIAVVSYPDYTDLHRTEDTFTGVTLRQPVRAKYFSGSYGSGTPDSYDYFDGVGMIFSIQEGMPLMQKVAVRNNTFQDEYLNNDTSGVRTTDPAEAASIHMSNQAYNFENVILKLDIGTSIFGDARTLYFIYGGCVNSTTTVNTTSGNLMPQQVASPNPDGSFGFDDFRFSGNPTQYTRTIAGENTNRQWYNFDDGDFGGYFYMVNEASSDLAVESQLPVEDNPSGTLHIQLSCTNILNFFLTDLYYAAKYQGYTDGFAQAWIGSIEVADADATFIKYTPVRKCGKVDVYTKKSGIISSAVGNSITSPGHTLQTHDIIKITSALWDGTQTGAKDIHPLNGNKFVKVVDVDTFKLYEDQFFERPVTTTKLRTTDGIAWVCIGNSNGNDAQSWKYNQTLFSPTGKNGYRATTTGKYKTTTRYNKAFLSGTQQTGLDTENNSIYVDFSILPADSTPLISSPSDRKWGVFDSNGFMTTISSSYNASSYYGKMIRDFIDSTPLVDFGESPLDTFNKGPQDFFPFTTSEINSTSAPKYTGTRFGSSVDMNFSHSSGSSKVYTLVVGEPGSDYSVDMFGVTAEECQEDSQYTHWMLTEENSGQSAGWKAIANTGRKRVQPYYQPYGKVHVFSVTVDQYGRISDITAQNTVFGDGSSVNNTCSNEEHPWETFMGNVRSNNYVGVNTTAGRRQMQAWSYLDGTFDTSYTSEDNGDKFSVIRMENLAPFNETLPDDSSLYWDRASIANWSNVQIFDYFINSSTQNPVLLRQGPTNRNLIYTNNSSVAYSRFGYGLNQPVIDRFNVSNTILLKSNFYIMPWVDMFGKSVAVSNSNDSGSILVFGSASVRSNIDYHGVSRSDSGTTVFRPVCTIQSGLTSENTDEYSIFQLGQISCVRVNRMSSYDTTQVVEINSGGSVDSSTTPVDPGEVFTRDTTGIIPFTIKELRTGEKVGGDNGIGTILRSVKGSCNSIVFYGDHIVFSEHNIDSGYSKLYMLLIERSNNSFDTTSSVTNYFYYTDKTLKNHEGFGDYIRYDDNILVTNSLVSSNNARVPVSTLVEGLETYDAILAFTFNGSNLVFQQGISASFSSLDTRYSQQLIPEYRNYLLDVENITYNNTTFQSHTWNIRLPGKYDTISGNIILKDPIEYALFSLNSEFSGTNQAVRRESTQDVSPYLEFTEIFTGDTVYYDYGREYGKDNEYRILDRCEWTNISAEQFQNTQSITRTPVFFLSVPSDAVDDYGNLTITINKENTGRILASYWNVETAAMTSVIDSLNSLVPQIALYRKDPRAMIVPNGPSATGSDASSPITYTNGIYNLDSNIFRNDDLEKIQTPATPPLFRGGANDLFHYSSNPGTQATLMVPEVNDTYDYTYARQYFNGESNLGELFDATYNQLGNVNKGLISWFANDVRRAAEMAGVNEGENCVPYGTIFSNFTLTGLNRFTFTIPFSVWGKFVVNQDLIKTPSDNRPLYSDFTRIKHGTAGIDLDPPTGLWDYTYDDPNRSTYINGNRNSDISLIVGLVFTRNSTINQDGSVSYNTSSPVYQYARYFGPKEAELQRYSYNYSYSPWFGGIAGRGGSNFSSRTRLNNIHMETYINGIDFSFDVIKEPARRFRSKFHRIAYFEYNNEVYSEAQRNLIESRTNDVERYAFGRYSFVPYPVGPAYDYTGRNVDTNQKAVSINPIIRLGKSNSSTQITDGNIGTFSDSIQVLATESVGGKSSIDATFYAKDGDNGGIYSTTSSEIDIGTAFFANQNMLGNFDINEPEGLSLFISAVRTENSNTTLYVRNQISSGIIPLEVSGLGINSGVATLFIKDDGTIAGESDMSIYGHGLGSGVLELFTRGQYEIANSGNTFLSLEGSVGERIRRGTELFLSAPLDFPGNVMPLWIGRDIDSSGNMPGFIEGRFVTPGFTADDETSTLFITGSVIGNGVYNSGETLYISGPDVYLAPLSGIAPLYITTDIPESGSTPGSFMYNTGVSLVMVEDGNSSAIPLSMEATIASTESMPLFINRDFANAIPLSIKNQMPSGITTMSVSGAFISSGESTLYISPPTANNTKLFTRGFLE
jgi:hypothetical protein